MEVSFTINGKLYKVNPETVPIDTSLNTFIRQYAQLSGTKFMCLEGGCGVCTITITGLHPVTKETKIWAANSCLVLVYACDGLDILTIEGLGNTKTGLHSLQKRLAEYHGTQCGYCSSGMIMNMYSLLEANGGKVSMADVENSFGGNICRCTGYRPILDAFKSFAIDSTENVKDIEDLSKNCTKNCQSCITTCVKILHLAFQDGREWFKVSTLEMVFDVLEKIEDKPYMFVAGNTAHGVYRRNPNTKIFIDVNDIAELKSYSVGDKLHIGANVSMTELMDIMKHASDISGLEYCKELSTHIDLIGHVAMRNIGTIAGNLSIKHQHREFPSDLFLILEACGASLTIADTAAKSFEVSIVEYLNVNMNKKMIVKVTLPKLDPTYFIFGTYKEQNPSANCENMIMLLERPNTCEEVIEGVSYFRLISYSAVRDGHHILISVPDLLWPKTEFILFLAIMPRAQNAHAYVNAAFLVEMGNGKVKSSRICFGGIEPSFIHATNTEEAIKDKDLCTDETLNLALNTLAKELQPDWVLPDASPEYRKNLALSLFYKFILSSCPASKVSPQYVSGGEILQRPLSSGTQSFDTHTNNWPLTQPVIKYEAFYQCTGEAQYANDIRPLKDELWAAFVVATKPHAKISKIDPSDVLKIPGVHQFFSAKDIPGANNFSLSELQFVEESEEIFVGVDSPILFNGQPIGVILADTFDLAQYAAKLVQIEYFYHGKLDQQRILPTLIKEKSPQILSSVQEPLFSITKPGTKVVKGQFEIGSQYHYPMESHTTVCVPGDNGEIDVYSATQWMDHVNIAIAECLALPANKINMIVRRLGGGFGAKITRATQSACACAIACYLTNRPIRFVLSIESCMTSIGARQPVVSTYEVEVDIEANIKKLQCSFVEDNGCSLNESAVVIIDHSIGNCYLRNDSWTINGKAVKTNAPSHSWFRAPGSTQGIAMIENIIEHIAKATNTDPIAVRLANIPVGSTMKIMLPAFLKDVDFYNRKDEIDKFNGANRWRKRGIAVIPMKFFVFYIGQLPAYVTIYHKDGTIAISHGGIECGQGLNTKVAQVAAHILGVPLEFIRIKPSNNLVSANACFTGASITSESICYSVKRACQELLQKIQPVKNELKKDSKWTDIIAECFKRHIDLSAKYTCKPDDLQSYNVWGCSCAEIELDILTGVLQLNRVDILEDVGESISPRIDVGQIEGGFMMGVSNWLYENLVYERQTGELLTNRTWTYKPAGANDIPVDFRIKFVRNSTNPFGVLRSKGTGEPAFCMAYVVVLAARYALDSARKNAGLQLAHFPLDGPTPRDVLFMNAGTSVSDFKLL